MNYLMLDVYNLIAIRAIASANRKNIASLIGNLQSYGKCFFPLEGFGPFMVIAFLGLLPSLGYFLSDLLSFPSRTLKVSRRANDADRIAGIFTVGSNFWFDWIFVKLMENKL